MIDRSVCMKKKIERFEDVQLLVKSFYDKILQDEKLSPFFSYVKSNRWEEHLTVLTTFWKKMLFYTGGYFGNPLEVHKTLHHFKKLDKEDFSKWLRLFNQTIDELFEGEKAELARQRALTIATSMQIKILPRDSDDNNGQIGEKCDMHHTN